jgi:hypothetical protein
MRKLVHMVNFKNIHNLCTRMILRDCVFRYEKLDFLHGCCGLETMHKLVHMVNFNTSVQALTLLFQILDSRDSVNDR